MYSSSDVYALCTARACVYAHQGTSTSSDSPARAHILENRKNNYGNSNGGLNLPSLFRGSRYYATSLLVSAAAALMIAFHAASWGQIDLTSVALLLIFISPWLFPYVTKISLPGGGGIELQVEALEQQTEKIPSPRAIGTRSVPKQVALAYRINKEDPNLALASIRMGLEQSLRQISRGDEDAMHYSIRQLMGLLARRRILSDELVDPIDSIIRICNRALHQADVSRPTAERVIAASIPVFDTLDNIAKRSGYTEDSD